MVMDAATRQTLELFVEKKDELASYVVEQNYGGLMGVFRREGDEEWQNYPELRGFLLTFRLFVQQSDGIAIYLPNRRSPLLDLPEMSAGWRQTIEQACRTVALYLGNALPTLIYNGQPITRWEVLQTFLYGFFAYTNQRERFLQWRREPALFGDLQFEFVGIAGFIFGQIMMVAEASRQELAH